MQFVISWFAAAKRPDRSDRSEITAQIAENRSELVYMKKTQESINGELSDTKAILLRIE